MNYLIKEFTRNYMKGVENIIFRTAQSLNPNKEDFDKETLRLLINHRNNINTYLKEELNEDDISLINKKDIKKSLLEIYNKKDLPTKLDNFIDTIFYSSTIITERDINSFKEKIDNFRTSQNINILYDIAFVSEDTKEAQEMDSDIRTALTHAFQKLEKKDKAELFANLNIFFEKYMTDPVGNKHLELISKEFVKEKEKNEQDSILNESEKIERNQALANDWLMNIVEIANNSTPENVSIDLDTKSNIKYKTAGGSTFDGIYFIPFYNLNEAQTKELNELSNLEDFYKFEAIIENTKQTQISATADPEQMIEGNSIVRHALSNSIIAKVINIHNMKENGRLEDILKKGKTKTKINAISGGNSTLRGYITEAFSDLFEPGTFWNSSFKDKSDEDSVTKKYNAILQKLTEEPLKIISILINKEENTKFSKQDLEKFIDYKKEELSIFKEVITPETYVSLYQENDIIKQRKKALDNIQKNDPNSPLSDLNGPELDRLFQYSALLKYKEVGESKSENLTSEALSLFVQHTFNLRAYSSKKSVHFDNENLSKKNLDDVSLFVLDKFVMNEHAENNQPFLISTTKKNIDIIINDVLENRDPNFYDKLGHSESDVVKRIISLKEKGLLLPINSISQKEALFLNKTIEQENKLLEQENKLLEQNKEILKEKTEDLVDKIYRIQENGLNRRDLKNSDYIHLTEIMKKRNFSFDVDNDESEALVIDFIKENQLAEKDGIVLCLNKIQQEECKKNIDINSAIQLANIMADSVTPENAKKQEQYKSNKKKDHEKDLKREKRDNKYK